MEIETNGGTIKLFSIPFDLFIIFSIYLILLNKSVFLLFRGVEGSDKRDTRVLRESEDEPDARSTQEAAAHLLLYSVLR